ncbi:unnamed protein product, partial [marine sediment metagenome]
FQEDVYGGVRFGGYDFVRLDYLKKNWKSKVAEKKTSLGKGFDKEFLSFRDTLESGEWPKRLSPVVAKTIDWARDEFKNLNSKLSILLSQRPDLLAVLRRVLNKVSLDTVERYLDARRVNVYLITFRLDGGSLRRLLDCLVEPGKKSLLEEIGIELNWNDHPKYKFKQYTNNARIGAIPKGCTFEQFHNAFQEDFKKIIDSRRCLIPQKGSSLKKRPDPPGEWDWDNHDLEGIELLLHRFGLSRGYFYGFASNISRPHASEKIRDLFGEV